MSEKQYKKNWSEYYEITKNKPPSKLLVKALAFVESKNKAIDIGGGALKDTRYLLEQGFDVTVIDQEELLAEYTKEVTSDKLHFFVTSFEKFNFPKETYNIASTMYSLPFNAPNTFNLVFNNIKESLVKGGIFCGQLFGTHDEWSKNNKMTFHTKERAEKLFTDMEIISLEEWEKDDKKADGTKKYWHVIEFIAKKI